VRVERVHEHGERQAALELRRRAVEHNEPASLGLPAQLREEESLTDPGLALHDDVGRGALLETIECLPEQPDLGLTPDDTRVQWRMATLPATSCAARDSDRRPSGGALTARPVLCAPPVALVVAARG
jgi:hypothetical protein